MITMRGARTKPRWPRLHDKRGGELGRALCISLMRPLIADSSLALDRNASQTDHSELALSRDPKPREDFALRDSTERERSDRLRASRPDADAPQRSRIVTFEQQREPRMLPAR